MTDRELLEMAAKAASIGGGWDWPRGAKAPTFWRDSTGKAWLPLVDDGDALRLAVKLVLCPQWYGGTVYVSHPGNWTCEPIGSDRLAATRRAIVRAAAEIGRQMP
jgi:hypothetical protein